MSRAICRLVLGIIAAVFTTASSVAVLVSVRPEARPVVMFALTGKQALGTDRVILQQRRNDCGPAAAVMLFRAYGLEASLSGLTEELGLTPEGVSMSKLQKACVRRGLRAECWRVPLADLRRTRLPAIAFVRGNHFVVIEAIEPNGNLVIADPANGRARVTPWRFRIIWHGDLLKVVGT